MHQLDRSNRRLPSANDDMSHLQHAATVKLAIKQLY